MAYMWSLFIWWQASVVIELAAFKPGWQCCFFIEIRSQAGRIFGAWLD